MSSHPNCDAFVDNLLTWYDDNGRHGLPWRENDASPFEVLVAELMLQQTSVEQVREVFEEFVEKFPDPESVVAVSEEEITEEIEPLGLQKRTKYFREASHRIIEQHGGDVPDDRSELLDLHGVESEVSRLSARRFMRLPWTGA